jgi:Na+-driven multidrug efflux pump
LIPILGIKGAAISSSSSQIIMAIINLHYLSHKIGIPKRDFILLNNKDISLFSEFVGSFFRKTK